MITIQTELTSRAIPVESAVHARYMGLRLKAEGPPVIKVGGRPRSLSRTAMMDHAAIGTPVTSRPSPARNEAPEGGKDG